MTCTTLRLAALLAVATLVTVGSHAFATSVLPNAIPTIDLPTDGRGSVPHAVAYHPGFDRYFGADSGSPNRRAWVWDNAGTIVQNFPPPIGVDYRGVNYNPNTNAVEVVTFNAVSGDGGGVRGLMTMGITATGEYDGTSVNTLASLPGLAGSQTVPSYNSTLDVLYSRSSGSTVNVVRRSDGLLDSTIALDFAAAGNPSVQNGFLGFDQTEGALIVLEPTQQRAHVFNLSGGFLGTSQVSGVNTVNSNGNTAYTNGQLFVFDATQGADGTYHGFLIFDPIPEPATMGLAIVSAALIACRRGRRIVR